MMNREYFCTDQAAEKEAIASATEANQLKETRWQAAQELGICGDLTFLARHLGHDPASVEDDGTKAFYASTHGPKRRLRIAADGSVTLKKVEAVVDIFWDGYGGYTTAWIGSRQVYSSHSTSRLIIPGSWLLLALGLLQAARNEAGVKAVQVKATGLSKALSNL